MARQFDHEKLDVYRLELRFVSWVAPVLGQIEKAGGSTTRAVRDHLDRASLSALLNTAEGNGKRQRQTRAQFFDVARGSATECAACLDAAVAKGVLNAETAAEGKAMLVRIASMLTKLVQRFDSGGVVSEDETPYGIEGGGAQIEDEDDDENEDD